MSKENPLYEYNDGKKNGEISSDLRESGMIAHLEFRARRAE